MLRFADTGHSDQAIAVVYALAPVAASEGHCRQPRDLKGMPLAPSSMGLVDRLLAMS
jgi:hypothetical protein